jgi:hypothetical protein
MEINTSKKSSPRVRFDEKLTSVTIPNRKQFGTILEAPEEFKAYIAPSLPQKRQKIEKSPPKQEVEEKIILTPKKKTPTPKKKRVVTPRKKTTKRGQETPIVIKIPTTNIGKQETPMFTKFPTTKQQVGTFNDPKAFQLLIDKSTEKEELITTMAIGDTIRLPRNELRGPFEMMILRKIGSGAYGEVYHVSPKDMVLDYFPKGTYALKRMIKIDKPKAFEYEQMIMNTLRNAYKNFESRCAPHVLCYFDISKSKDGRYYFLSELMDGDLTKYMGMINTDKKSMKLALEVFHQVLEGLQELQSVGLIHRDLKPDNILYEIPVGPSGRQRPSGITFKIGDYGLSCIPSIDALRCGKSITGTPKYIDPLIMDYIQSGAAQNMKEIWDETNDIYSLAVILYQILFGDYLTNDVYRSVRSGAKDALRNGYQGLYEQKVKNVQNEMMKYGAKSKEGKLLRFIERNIIPFEKKLTIEESKKYL